MSPPCVQKSLNPILTSTSWSRAREKRQWPSLPRVKPGSIQGLVYREGPEIRDNGLRTDLCELDSLPFPAYHKLEGFPKRFEAALFNYPKAPSATIISSRGCPYQCSYCDRSVYRRSFRYNSAEYLYDHMAFLKKEFNIRHVFFYDDLFYIQPRAYRKILRTPDEKTAQHDLQLRSCASGISMTHCSRC